MAKRPHVGYPDIPNKTYPVPPDESKPAPKEPTPAPLPTYKDPAKRRA